MTWFQLVGYVCVWLVVFNMLYVGAISVYRPSRLCVLIRTMDGTCFDAVQISSVRANAHLYGAFGGVVFVGFKAYEPLLEFIPLDWGTHSESGGFQPFRYTLAGFLALFSAYLVLRAFYALAKLEFIEEERKRVVDGEP